MRQRFNGQQGVFFSLRNFGKGGMGGRAGASEPRKGPRANLEDGDSYHTHVPLENGQCIFPFFSVLPPSATRCGGQGREGARQVAPRKSLAGRSKACTHTPLLSPTHTTRTPTPSETHAHKRRHTNMHNTQAGLLFRWTGASTASGQTGHFASAGHLTPLLPPFPGFLCMLHVQSLLGFLFLSFPPCSDNVFFYPCELFIMSHT